MEDLSHRSAALFLSSGRRVSHCVPGFPGDMLKPANGPCWEQASEKEHCHDQHQRARFSFRQIALFARRDDDERRIARYSM